MRRLGLFLVLFTSTAGCRSLTLPQSFESRQIEGEFVVRGAEPTDSAARPKESLELAADCLARGDDAGAANHLSRHVTSHPDQLVFRAQLADLLARLDRLPEAQAHLSTAAAQAQSGSAAARGRLVHYHTRLMEIARLRGDEYGEHLNRGIGLYLVAMRLAKQGESSEAERLFCKSAAALKEAQASRPDVARPSWYLYCVWQQLDQPRPAQKALQKAIANAPFSDLTPAEARELASAGRAELPVK